MKDHIIDENENCKDIVLRWFYYKLFEEEDGGGTRRVLGGYTYLNYITELWPFDSVNQMGK